ncbi:MAG: hypothetical protein SVV80_13680, partial [Planctomycetota bacterium]|nr:hypothetical protein [Planctomycetota bacterium]
MPNTRKHTFLPLALLVVLAVYNRATACSVTVNIVGCSVAKGATDDAVAMDITVSGTDEGVVELTKDYTGTGRVAIWNADRTATISQVNVTDCPIRLWVQGTTESSAVADVTITATLKVDGQTTGTDSDTVTVVKVDKIQYQSGENWIDVSETLYVSIGTTVTFKAIPDPAAASWPGGKPVWGGTSGASGTGETKDVTFNAVGNKTVTAECGNTVTANVIVVEVASLLPDQGTEVDDGDADPDTKWYVVPFVEGGGDVTVTATPNPAVSEADLPADWTLTGAHVEGKLVSFVYKDSP